MNRTGCRQDALIGMYTPGTHFVGADREKTAGSWLADCGNSLPSQDAVIGAPENPERFRGLPKWAVDRPHSRAGPRRAFSTDS